MHAKKEAANAAASAASGSADIHMASVHAAQSDSTGFRFGLPPSGTIPMSSNQDRQGRVLSGPTMPVGPFRGRGRSNSQPPQRRRSSSRSDKRTEEQGSTSAANKVDPLFMANAELLAAPAELLFSSSEDGKQCG